LRSRHDERPLNPTANGRHVNALRVRDTLLRPTFFLREPVILGPFVERRYGRVVLVVLVVLVREPGHLLVADAGVHEDGHGLDSGNAGSTRHPAKSHRIALVALCSLLRTQV
jgi:hypothetical protein